MAESTDPTAGTGDSGVTDPDVVDDPCAADNADNQHGLRIAAIFIILVTSLIGTLAPILLRSTSFIPRPFFEFAKFFGSGVIIATAFIHLLAPAFDELGSSCLSGTWTEYDWAPAIAMASVYGIFFAEVAAYRLGTSKMAKLGISYSAHADEPTDAHAHSHTHLPAVPPADVEQNINPLNPITPHSHSHSHSHGHGHGFAEKNRDVEGDSADSVTIASHASHSEAASQLIAVAVLEFGVVLHSVIIGLTLATSSEFNTLFVVIIFHQMFEGLGLGSRLASLNLPGKWTLARYLAGCFYAICTPVGVAIGLGVRSTYNGNGAKANIISGVLDATSAGILLYTGLVELMAHEILLNPRAMKFSSKRLTWIFGCMLLGSGLMALLGRWA